MELQPIRQKLYEKKNKIGLVGGSLKVVEYDEADHNVSAHINPQGWNIEMAIKKGFDPVSDKRQKAYARKKNITNGLEMLLSDVLLHECAHWELPHGSQMGCPYDTYHHDKMLEAVNSNLPDEKKGMAGYVLNMFEDMIINPRCHEFNGSFSGQVLFWDNEGLSTQAKGQKGYPPIYEAFVKLNMHLFGDKTDQSLLKRHYLNNKKVDKAVANIVEDLSLPPQIKDTTQLFNKDAWPEMAGTFARHVADILDAQPPQERLSAFSDQEGQGQQGKQQQPAGNGIEKKMRVKEGKDAVAFGRYASGDRQSPHFTSYEQLDSVYQQLAKAIPVKVEAMTREQSLQIAPLNYRAFNEEKDDPVKMKTSKFFVNDQGIQFAYARQPLTITAKSKVQRKSFPDFKLVMLDNSQSMQEAADGSNNVGNTQYIPWGDKSKYHYALLGFYGIENFLNNQGIAQYINHGLSLFSSSTRYKEAGFNGIDEVRRHALNPDWGNTYIDAQTLVTALNGRESLVLSLSDGEIANWDTEKDNFRKGVENNHYAHLQIGGKSKFTKDLESWGVPVFYVTEGEHLARLMVDVTKNTYQRLTHQ